MKGKKIHIKKNVIYVMALLSFLLVLITMTACFDTETKGGDVIKVYISGKSESVCEIVFQADLRQSVVDMGNFSSYISDSTGEKFNVEKQLPTDDESGYIAYYTTVDNLNKTVKITESDCILKGSAINNDMIRIDTVNGESVRTMIINPVYYTKFTSSDDNVYLVNSADSGKSKTINVNYGATLKFDVTQKEYYNFVKYTFSYNTGNASKLFESDKNGVFNSAWTYKAKDITVKAEYAPKEYKVYFDESAGEAVGEKKEVYTAKYASFFNSDKIYIPTREGYDFTGWYSHAQNGDVQIGKKLIDEKGNLTEGAEIITADNYTVTTEGITLYAGWKKHSYELLYNAIVDDGSGDKEVEYYREDKAYGASILKPKDPERLGYIFSGWLKSGTKDLMNFDEPMFALATNASKLLLNASWTPKTNYVKYEGNGGSTGNGSTSLPETAIKTGATGILSQNSFVRKGYEFMGWSTDKAATAPEYLATQEFSINKKPEVTMYAVWSKYTYYIVYKNIKVEGGKMPDNYTIITTGISSLPTQYTITDEVILPDVARIAYEFKGWYLDEGFINKVGKISEGNSGTKELYAKFIPINYNVTYELNGGTNDPFNPVKYNYESSSDRIIILKEPTKNGYDFVSWYTDEKFTKPVDRLDIQSAKDYVFYAKWSEAKQYRIEYINLEGAAYSDLPQSYDIEAETELPLIRKRGYRFLGWKLNGVDGYTATIAKGKYGDVTLEACFELLTLYFDYQLNGGNNDSENVSSYNVTEYPDFLVTFKHPTRDGYSFISWCTDDALTKTLTDDTYEITVDTAARTVLYAKWSEPIKYGIEYLNVEGINENGLKSEYTVEEGFELATVSKFGYVFKGWKKEGELYSTERVQKGTCGKLVFNAIFDPIKYHITYNLYGGSIAENKLEAYTLLDADEYGYVELKAPTKKGYNFIGWYLDERYSNFVTNEERLYVYGVTSSEIVLHARWSSAIPYDVSYTKIEGIREVLGLYQSYTVENDFVLPTVSKFGYIFKGWKLDNNGEYISVIKSGTMVGTLTFAADFVEEPFYIEYYLNGGVNPQEAVLSFVISEVNADGNVLLISPSKKGYSFVGWYYDEGFTRIVRNNLLNVNILVQGVETKLYAKWSEPIEYEITYKGIEGINERELLGSYNVEREYDLPIVSKFGYTFVGWLEEGKEASSYVSKINKGTLGAVTYRAVFSADTFTVKYELNGGSLVNGTATEYKLTDVDRSGTIMLLGVVKTGYVFKGWYLDSQYTTLLRNNKLNVYSVEDSDSTDEEVIVYAKWSNPIDYAVSYLNIDGINERKTLLENNVYNIEEEFILPSVSKFGYEFKGWKTDEADKDFVAVIPKGSHGDKSFLAIFEACTFFFDYELNGGTNAEEQPNSFTLSATDANGEIAIKPATRLGYTFMGWYLDSYFGTPLLNGKYNVNITANDVTTLYARWSAPIKYGISYKNVANVNETDLPAYYTVEDSLTLPTLTKFGRVFECWKNEETGAATTGIEKGTTGAKSFIAEFGYVTFTVDYVLSGGEVVEPRTSFTLLDVDINNTVSLNKAERKGYNFVAWYLDKDYSRPVYNERYIVDSTTPVAITLYAKWSTPVIYTISYNNIEGIREQNLVSGYTIEEAIVLPEVSKYGYTFIGWKKDNTSAYYTSIPLNSVGNVTFTAKFEPITYHFNYVLNKGVNAAEAVTSYTLDDESVRNSLGKLTLPVAERTGYSFVGWCYDEALARLVADNKYDVYKAESTTINLYAKWTPKQYTVTYRNITGTNLNLNELVTSYTIESETFVLPSTVNKPYDIFKGWKNAAIDGYVREIRIGSIGDIVLTAEFEHDTYYFRYTLDGGKNAVNNLDSFTSEDADENGYITLLPAVRNGYSFLGWCTDPDFATVLVGSKFDFKTLDENRKYVDLYAKWSAPIQYSIIYNDVSGINELQLKASYNITEDFDLQRITKFGYVFRYWKKTATGETFSHIAKGTTGDIEITAVFRYADFKFKYELNGGVNAVDAVKTFTLEPIEGSVVAENKVHILEPTKVGYDFEGWYYDKDFARPLTDNKFDVIPTTDTNTEFTLFAKWSEPIEYTITYLNIDGIGESMEKSKYTVNDEFELQIVSRFGYIFKGWKYADGSSASKILKGTTGNLTLTAMFDYNNFELAYELNGGKFNESAISDFTFADFDVEDKLELTVPVKAGYTFQGWHYDAAYSRRLADNKLEKALNFANVVVLYAKWSQPIEYAIDYGVSEAVASEFKLKTSYTVEEEFNLSNIERFGYSFQGWRKSDGGILVGVQKGSVGNISVTPAWSLRRYVITLNLKGGTLTEAFETNFDVEQTRITDGNISLPNATKKGYNFQGWGLKEQENTIIASNLLDINDITWDIVLYAKWSTPIEYVISYQNIEGINERNLVNTYTVEDEFTYAPVSKPFYIFNGWYINNTFTSGIVKGSIGNITLSPSFSVEAYTFEYVLNGGINAFDATTRFTVNDVDETNSITLKPASKLGYTFLGWCYDESLKNVVENNKYNINKTSDKNILYAKWSEAMIYRINYQNTMDVDLSKLEAGYSVENELVLPVISQFGYQFMCWKDVSTGLAISKIAKGSVGDLTVTAEWELKRFEFAFILEQGGVLSEGTTTDFTINDGNEERKIEIIAPMRNGYTFGGWYYDEDRIKPLTNNMYDIMASTSDRPAVYAKWIPIEYTITYLGIDDADSVPKKTTYNIEDAFVLESVKKFGYTFLGWRKSANDEYVRDINKGSYGALTLNAYFELTQFVLKYEFNNGSEEGEYVGSVNLESYPEGGIVVPGTSKVGYEFDNWYMDAEYKNPIVNGKYDLHNASGSEIKLYARFIPIQYQLIYNNIDGINENGLKATFTVEEAFSLPIVTKFGFVFTGWKNDFDGTIIESISVGYMGNVTVTAQFEIATLSVIYETGGKVNISTTEYKLSDLVDGVLRIGNATSLGYDFLGWYYDSEYNEACVDNLFSPYVKKTHNTTLYAKWSNAIVYTLEYRNIENIKESSQIDSWRRFYTVEDTLELPVISKLGYTFLGWYDSADKEFKSPIMGSVGNLILTARWSDSLGHKAQYELYGGTNHSNNKSVYTVLDCNSNNEIELLNPTKEGYDFLGWYLDSAYRIKVIDNKCSLSEFNQATLTLTFHAKWSEPYGYAVNYRANGGNGAMASTAFTYDSGAPLTRNAFTRTYSVKYVHNYNNIVTSKVVSYIFIGWNTQPNGTGTAYADGEYLLKASKEKNGVIDLYAQWRINGETTPSLSNQKEGYTFAYWCSDSQLGVKAANSNEKYTPSAFVSELTLYARWNVNYYNLTYTTSNCTLTVKDSTGKALSSGTSVSYGTRLTITFTPVTHFGNVNATFNGASISSNSSVTMPAKDSQIKVTATQVEYKVTISGSNCSFTVTCGGIQINNGYYARVGSSVVIAFWANNGYEGAWCKKNGASVGSGHVFSMPSGNIELTYGASVIPPPPKSKGSSCLAEGTPMMRYNGTTVPIEALKTGDKILAFNHTIGEFEETEVAYLYIDYDNVYVTDLVFSNGMVVTVLNMGHGFFNTDLNKYVLVDYDNVAEYVGSNFLYLRMSQGKLISSEVTLVAYKTIKRWQVRYDVITVGNITHVANGFLSCTDVMVEMCNLFNMDADMQYDEAEIQESVSTYGLYDYSEWADFVPEEVFYAFNGPLFKVCVGKGMIDVGFIERLVALFDYSEWTGLEEIDDGLSLSARYEAPDSKIPLVWNNQKKVSCCK